MDTFAPTNPLEHRLLDARAGQATTAQLLEALFASQVYVLLNVDLGVTGAWRSDALPLVLNSPTGVPLIALFSAPERAQGWPERAPAFPHGVLIDFHLLLRDMAPGVGVVLNPGLALGVELSPTIMQGMRERVLQK